MSFRTNAHTSHVRHSMAPLSASSSASTSTSHSTLHLQQRISEKRLELENLKQMRDLSAGLAGQMEQLETKLGTLSTGAEAIAAVMSNWHNVLRAIAMASAGLLVPSADAQPSHDPSPTLPQTLVRIPVQDLRPAPTEGGDDEDREG